MMLSWFLQRHALQPERPHLCDDLAIDVRAMFFTRSWKLLQSNGSINPNAGVESVHGWKTYAKISMSSGPPS
jgi:hypothetical protein